MFFCFKWLESTFVKNSSATLNVGFVASEVSNVSKTHVLTYSLFPTVSEKRNFYFQNEQIAAYKIGAEYNFS
jgi:hypothetical protein